MSVAIGNEKVLIACTAAQFAHLPFDQAVAHVEQVCWEEGVIVSRDDAEVAVLVVSVR